MSKNITADNGVEIAVGLLGLEVTDPAVGLAMYARLSPWQRRSLSDALDQGSAVVIGGRLTAPESQFKRERDDLRRQVSDLKERRRKHVEEREAWTRNRRELESARDAAVARAEQAEQLIPAYAMLDIWVALGRDSIHFDDWYDEHGYADAWAELTSAVREARTAPAVSRADIEKAVRSAFKVWGYDRVTGQELEVLARIRPLFDRIEFEHDVDPVEEKARELYEVGNPGTVGMWESIHEAFKDGYRRIARHVLGQEADHA